MEGPVGEELRSIWHAPTPLWQAIVALDGYLGTRGRGKEDVQAAVLHMQERLKVNRPDDAQALVHFLRPDTETQPSGPVPQNDVFALVFRTFRDMARERPVILAIDDQSNHRFVAEKLIAGWRKHLGVNIRMSLRSWPKHTTFVKGQTYHLARSGWIGDYRDPLSFLALFDENSSNPHTR